MAITRVADRRVYSFRSVGEKTELSTTNASTGVEPPPVGIRTPVSLSERGKNFLSMHDNFPDQVHDNLQNLILTNHGERLGLHDFGANLAELTFEMQEEDIQNEAMTRVSAAVRKYMPYVDLQTFSPFIEHFDNKEVAKVGLTIGYNVPKLRVKSRMLEIVLFAAG